MVTAGLEAMMNRQSNKTTALYCRLANFTEADSLTAKNQMDRLAAYAAENGLQNPEFFCDWGFSGTNTGRPEYQRMLQPCTPPFSRRGKGGGSNGCAYQNHD